MPAELTPRETDQQAALGENYQELLSDRGSTPLISTKNRQVSACRFFYPLRSGQYITDPRLYFAFAMMMCKQEISVCHANYNYIGF